MEASGIVFGSLGPPFWKVLDFIFSCLGAGSSFSFWKVPGSIFEGFGPWKPPESSAEASGLHFARSWT